MKKFLICIIVLVLFACNTNKEETKQKDVKDKLFKIYYRDGFTDILGVKIEGHDYIIYTSTYKGNIIHGEHCPCHDKIE